MKKIFIGSFVFLMSLITSAAPHGGSVGNGGDVVTCVNATNKTEVFDVYEARALRGWNLNLGDAQLSVEEKVELAISRINDNLYTPGMRNLLLAYAQSFWNDYNLVPASTLVDIPDTLELSLPVGCVLTQTAIQIKNPSVFDKRYLINGDIWNILDNDNKAALILHEVVYRVAIQQGAQNSIGSRLINSMLFSDKISSFDWNLWFQAWEVAGFKQIIVGAAQIPMSLENATPLVKTADSVTGAIQYVDCPQESAFKLCIQIGTNLIETVNANYGKQTVSLASKKVSGQFSNLHLGSPGQEFTVLVNSPVSMSFNGSVEIKTDSYCIFRTANTGPTLPGPDSIYYIMSVKKADGTWTNFALTPGNQRCMTLTGDLIP